MKKISIFLCLAFLLSACSSSSSGVMRCSTQREQEQMSSTVTMNFSYEDDIVKSQESETEITIMTLDAFEQMKALADSSSAVFKTIPGTIYEVQIDDEKKTMTEKVTIDFTTISKEDKAKVLSYEGSEDMNVKDIQEALQSQSFTCTK